MSATYQTNRVGARPELAVPGQAAPKTKCNLFIIWTSKRAFAISVQMIMNHHPVRTISLMVASLLLVSQGLLSAQEAAPAEAKTAAPAFSGQIVPQSILTVMEKVADWQLAHESTNRATGWIQAVGDIGIVTLAGISSDPKYRETLLAKGEYNGWRLPEYQGRKYHADDHAIGQVWAELYSWYRAPRMIEPARKKFDWIMANPSSAPSLDFSLPKGKSQELWSWCDALFMAPPTLARLSIATGDPVYLDFALTNWWKTTDYLYDQKQHLFFRDSTFFKKQETNGQSIFWSRGNGWVLAATVRMLEVMPANHPGRARLKGLFQEMAEKILTLQQPDGLWRASLLDPTDYPMPESSGSALFTYAIAWGINQDILDRDQYELVVQKAWPALVACVEADGKLTHIQPAGDHPVTFEASSTAAYGGGVFLLAGSEVYRYAVLQRASGAKTVHVTNPAAFARECETVDLKLIGKLAVLDGNSAKVLDSQSYVDADGVSHFLFQVDLAPGESHTYTVLNAADLPAVPVPLVKTFARYVPERFDDFAWESDRIAHRIYGQALIAKEGTISSGADVWIKKDRRLIVDEMYRTKHYHEDNGEFMDDFRVGKSRGCGGLGIWDGQKLFVSSNWKNYKVITTGPIRSEFELTYDAWDAGNGRNVSEVKRFSIDAGSLFTKAQCVLSSSDPARLTLGVGLAERSSGPDGSPQVGTDKTEGWMTYWQPEDKPKGITATAIVLPKNSVTEFTTDEQNMPDAKLHEVVPQPTHEGAPAIRNLLAITAAEVGKPFTYYFGACWDRSGDFTDRTQWETYTKRFAERRDQPLRVTVGD